MLTIDWTGTDMEMPNIDNKIVDTSTGVVFNVKAYRRLNQDECVMAVRTYLLSRKPRSKKLKKVIVSPLFQ
jgi:hypothetical protein